MPKRKRLEENKGDQIITKFFQRSTRTGRNAASNPVTTESKKRSATQRVPSSQRAMSSSRATSSKETSSSANTSASASSSRHSSAASKPSPSRSKEPQIDTSPILEAFKRQELKQRQKAATGSNTKGDGKEECDPRPHSKEYSSKKGLTSAGTAGETAKTGMQGSKEKALPKRRLEYEGGDKTEAGSKKKQKQDVSFKISESKWEEFKVNLASSPTFKIKPGMLSKKAKEASLTENVNTESAEEPQTETGQSQSGEGSISQPDVPKIVVDQSNDSVSGPIINSPLKVQKFPAGSLKISEALKKVIQDKMKASPLKVAPIVPKDAAEGSTSEINREHPEPVDDMEGDKITHITPLKIRAFYPFEKGHISPLDRSLPIGAGKSQVTKTPQSKGEEIVPGSRHGKVTEEAIKPPGESVSGAEKPRGVMSLFQELKLSVKDLQDQEEETSEESQSSSATPARSTSQPAGEKAASSIKMNIAKLKQIIKAPSLSPQTSAANSPAPSDKGGESPRGTETKPSPGSESLRKGEDVGADDEKQHADYIRNLPSALTALEKQVGDSGVKHSDFTKDRLEDSEPEEVDLEESKAFDSDEEYGLESDDSDDDLLLMPVANLKDIQSASLRPPPCTPQKLSESQEMQCSPMSPATQVPAPRDVNFKFSLDDLLAEQNKTVGREPRRLRDVTDELMADVRQGGFRRMVADLEREEHECSDSDREGKLENPKHKKFVRDRNLKKMEIPDMHPGETVFNSKDMGRLFDFPGSLTPVSCGLVPPLDQDDPLHLLLTSPDYLEDMLTSGTLEDMYAYDVCPEPLQRWLFFLMSISRDQHVVNSAYKTLTSVFMSNWSLEEDDNPVWLPSLADVTRALLNYGAQLHDLYPLTSARPSFNEEDVSLPLHDSEKENQNGNVPSDTRGSQEGQRGLPAVNLVYILQTLSKLNAPPRDGTFRIYSEQDLVHLVCLLCRTLLDVQLRGLAVQFEFQSCISEILDWFEEERWPRIVAELCSSLPQLSSHHHNLVTLARHMPCTERGRYLQRRLSLCIMRKLLWKGRGRDGSTEVAESKGIGAENMDVDVQLTELTPLLPDCQMKNILELVSSERESQNSSQESDDGGRSFENDREAYYLLSTLVHLIDMGVGNEPLPTSQRDALAQVIHHLNSISGNIRDNIKLFHRSKVKNLVMRTVSKLNLLKDGMKKTQQSLFSYIKEQKSETPEQRGHRLEESGSSPIWKSGQLSETNCEDSESGTHRSGRLSAMSVESNMTGTASTRLASPEDEDQHSPIEQTIEPEGQHVT
ncbi:SMC5-SMC6 complex localization factor protein 2-like isoform X1 [Branchiostoma lanceolatum]|uniref:SMC5-SMC6 complex localization factor protein 2-like isoform X1 n=2 Tax=Branchiostoma lanceolatum TaxID=7740 RepID=UPI0034529DD1